MSYDLGLILGVVAVRGQLSWSHQGGHPKEEAKMGNPQGRAYLGASKAKWSEKALGDRTDGNSDDSLPSRPVSTGTYSETGNMSSVCSGEGSPPTPADAGARPCGQCRGTVLPLPTPEPHRHPHPHRELLAVPEG